MDPRRIDEPPTPTARVCSVLGCAAHLSRYNQTATCWLHGPGADPMRQPR